MNSGTFLGYKDADGNEMHCALAKCSDPACYKGCTKPVSRPKNNVVGLRGCAPCVKEPNADVVKKCEELLELARSGEITGIQCVTVGPDALAGLLRAGGLSYSAIGMLFCAAHDAVVELAKLE